MEETFTDKEEYGRRPKDHTFRGMPSWVREMYRISRRNAARREIPFHLTRQEFRDIVVRSENRCMMTGIAFELERYEGSCRRPFAPSLDRIDSAKGYSAENCRLICVLVNLAMNQWGLEPLVRVARNIVQREKELAEKEEADFKYRTAGFVFVSDFAKSNNIELRKPQFSLIGCAAGRISRRLGVDRAYMRRAGSYQHAYPVEIMAEAFREVLAR